MSNESINQTIRDFFDVRYALPGWVFIIFSLLWNPQIAIHLLNKMLNFILMKERRSIRSRNISSYVEHTLVR